MSTLPWRLATTTGALGLLALVLAGRRVVRLEVDGASMAPLLQAGDRLVALRGLPARLGDVVAAADPRAPARLLVKRVVGVDRQGRLELAGDNRAASTDSRHFGSVGDELVVGRVVWRYWPRHRRGRSDDWSPALVR